MQLLPLRSRHSTLVLFLHNSRMSKMACASSKAYTFGAPPGKRGQTSNNDPFCFNPSSSANGTHAHDMFSQLKISYGTYIEDESFLFTGDPEPNRRSQNIILHAECSKWHIKVTFSGTIPPRVSENSLSTAATIGKSTKLKETA